MQQQCIQGKPCDIDWIVFFDKQILESVQSVI